MNLCGIDDARSNNLFPFLALMRNRQSAFSPMFVAGNAHWPEFAIPQASPGRIGGHWPTSLHESCLAIRAINERRAVTRGIRSDIEGAIVDDLSHPERQCFLAARRTSTAGNAGTGDARKLHRRTSHPAQATGDEDQLASSQLRLRKCIPGRYADHVHSI